MDPGQSHQAKPGKSLSPNFANFFPAFAYTTSLGFRCQCHGSFSVGCGSARQSRYWRMNGQGYKEPGFYLNMRSHLNRQPAQVHWARSRGLISSNPAECLQRARCQPSSNVTLRRAVVAQATPAGAASRYSRRTSCTGHFHGTQVSSPQCGRGVHVLGALCHQSTYSNLFLRCQRANRNSCLSFAA